MRNLYLFLIGTAAGHFILYRTASEFVGSMPAPTVKSSVAYVWAFGFLNGLINNFSRMRPPKVEKSPNFQNAVALLNGGKGDVSQKAGPNPS